jgi:hypothetical protein
MSTDQKIMNEFAELLRENTALKQRVRDLEGRGVEQFNGHTELPWVRSKSVANVITDALIDDGAHPDIAVFQRYKCSEDAAFVLHAVNSYYPITSQVRELREAMQVCADSLDKVDDYLGDAGIDDTHPLYRIMSPALSRLKELGITPKP